MFDYNNKKWPSLLFPIPPSLKEIPDPPQKLYIRGKFPKTEKYLCIVGGRKHTDYGKAACEYIINGLRNYSISIVSGLALGIDTLAHICALENNLPTIAWPGSGLDDRTLIPRSHLKITRKILENDGCLLSEYEPNYPAHKGTFPERNRLMAAISDAVLIIEGKIKSGTLITARLGLEYNKTVLAVPGDIFSIYSEGPNYLIKEGAIVTRKPDDVIEALGLKRKEIKHQDNLKNYIEKLKENCSPLEIEIISELLEPKSKDELISASKISISNLNVILSTLELKEIIEEKMGKIHLKIF